jgi:uncharacterized damage-inducible protein DinB
MSRPLIDALLRSWEHQRDYALRLVADLSNSDMVAQPVAGVVMNHPAWTFSHLAIYPPVLTAILREEPFEDPAKSRWGRESKPSSSAHDYPPKAQLMDVYLRGHDELARVLDETEHEVLTRPIPLARWKERFPVIADAIVHLMIDHESAHLGQVSAWRRAGGRPPV